MVKTNFNKILSLIVSLVLVAAIALVAYGCGDKHTSADVTTTAPATTQTASATELGQGSNYFSFEVTDGNGNKSLFNIKTDKKTVGDALLELKLIEGEEAQYGLYVKKVNGISADYDTDGTYWAFYVNGEYATAGVDQTDIVNGATYAFKVEK